MTYLRLAGSVLCVCLCAAAAPATAPATTSAPTPLLDQSSPKALLRSFFLSHGEASETTIRSLLHAHSPAERKAVDAVVQVEMAHGRLRAVQKEKFGKATTAPSMTPGGSEADTPEEINSLQETIEGDRATVRTPGEPGMSMEFIRVDGRWKLPVASLVGPIDSTAPETMDSATRAQVEIIDAIAADVRSGRLANERQVREELTRRFAERLATAVKSSSQHTPSPTTAPVSKPARGT